METVYLDTHIVVWLREKALEKFSQKSLDAIENATKLFVSPIVVLELKYLYEIGRITDTPHNILGDLNDMIDLNIDEIDFYNVIKKSLALEWTRDPFDRLIVANTIARNSSLITKDEKILTNFDNALW